MWRRRIKIKQRVVSTYDFAGVVIDALKEAGEEGLSIESIKLLGYLLGLSHIGTNGRTPMVVNTLLGAGLVRKQLNPGMKLNQQGASARTALITKFTHNVLLKLRNGPLNINDLELMKTTAGFPEDDPIDEVLLVTLLMGCLAEVYSENGDYFIKYRNLSSN